MIDRHGFGRITTVWWTLNSKYNALYTMHRLNVRAELGRAAARASDDDTRDVRFDLVRAAPDLATHTHTHARQPAEALQTARPASHRDWQE